RYYDAFLRRFTQPDSIIANPYDPQNLNRYSYVLNNPLKYKDPDGHNPIYMLGGIVVAGVFDVAYFMGYADNVYSQAQNINPKSILPWYSNIDWDKAHLAGKQLGTDAAIAMGAEVILHQTSLRFSGAAERGLGKQIESARISSQARLSKETIQTIKLIDEDGPFPYPLKDGSIFKNLLNKATGKSPLPKMRGGYYREYTVPTPGSNNRGTQRLVAGEGGELYYTSNHYETFERIR
ncbi:hypothetical protein HZB01_03410, partial [Candidatus Woesearchaeota archaeon]|nr:hypothetical protein [Candidatus Woesearchaeota archaeon]